MMELYNIQNVEAAVTEFYRGQAKQTHQWLNNAKTSQEAWYFLWDLLQPCKTTEVQFFGALTLHTKIVKFWHEVPVENYEALKNRILQSIIEHHEGPKLILNKLCVSMAAYITHVFPHHWPSAVDDLISIFEGLNNEKVGFPQSAWILLEILMLLPEELQNSRLPIQRNDMIRELKNNMPTVLKLVNHFLGSSYFSELHEQASICATSWLRLCIPFPTYHQLSGNLLNVILNSLEINDESSDSTSEAALNCLECLVTHAETQKFPLYVEECLKQLLSLQAIIPSVNAPMEKDVYYKILRLFVVIGECHSQRILKMLLDEGESNEIATQIINVIINATVVPGRDPQDESLSTHAFGFWYILQEDVLALDSIEKDKALNLVIPVYTYLVEVLIKKSIIPDNFENWNREDKEKFRYYRQDIADSLIYCYQILNNRMLDILAQKFHISVGKCEEKWQDTESVLHAWLAIAEMVPGNMEHLTSFFDMIKKIPLYKLDTQLYLMAISCIGAFAEWMNNNPTYMHFGISLVLDGLKSAHVAPFASMVLKDIARECQITIQPYADEIIPIIENTLALPHIYTPEKTRLMNALGRLLSPMPFEKIMFFLNKFIGPFVKQLQDLSTLEMKPVPSTYFNILVVIEMLSALFSTLDIQITWIAQADEAAQTSNQETRIIEINPQPVLLILQNVLPILNNLMVVWGENEVIVKNICTLLKHAISTLLDSFSEVLDETLHILISTFQKFKQPPVLDLTQQIAVLLRSNENSMRAITLFVGTLCDVTISSCFDSEPSSENCNVIESFFNLLTQLLKKVPAVILHNNDESLKTLLHKAKDVLQLPETQTLKASISFLKTFIKQSHENSRMSNIVDQVGELLVVRIIQCIGGSFPRSLTDHLAELLLLLNKKPTPGLQNWMSNAVALLDSDMPEPFRTQFVSAVVKEKSNRRKIQELVRNFAGMSRGLGMQDAVGHAPFAGWN